MDMFNNLKGLLNNANLLGGAINDKSPPPLLGCINEEAGADILTHFQTQWEQLHANNEANAECVAKLANMIDQIHTVIDCQNSNLTKINQILNTPPKFQETIANCLEQITSLHTSFEQVEKDLILLEDCIERCELEEAKLNHKHQLNLYKEKKLLNLESARVDLASKHTKTVKDYERKQTQNLEERQQVFQEAFKNDMETYKTLGTIPKIEVRQQSSALLEEIQLDIDENELNEFLEEEVN